MNIHHSPILCGTPEYVRNVGGCSNALDPPHVIGEHMRGFLPAQVMDVDLVVGRTRHHQVVIGLGHELEHRVNC